MEEGPSETMELDWSAGSFAREEKLRPVRGFSLADVTTGGWEASKFGLSESFHREKKLREFSLGDVTIHKTKELGRGGCGSVVEVTYNHIQCAGKIFKAVGEYDDPTKWYQECQLMSSLHHPNITQFLGLYFPDDKTQLPILVMERLETTLHTLVLDMPNLPLSLKCSVLTDVASGLLYLHARPKPVAHKDLRARNVLLTSSLVAKITDIGFPHIANPGMNPNQMLASSIYKSSWDNRQPPDDIYDFGYLALFTLLQDKKIGDLPLCTTTTRGSPQIVVSERYVDILRVMYSSDLVDVVDKCLKQPNLRPKADELLVDIQKIKKEVEKNYGGPFMLDIVRMNLVKKVEKKEKEMEKQNMRYKVELKAMKMTLKREIVDETVVSLGNRGFCKLEQISNGWIIKYTEDEPLMRSEEKVVVISTRGRLLEYEMYAPDKGLIIGPVDTPFEGGRFHLEVDERLKIKFVTKIWYPQHICNWTGEILFEIFTVQERFDQRALSVLEGVLPRIQEFLKGPYDTGLHKETAAYWSQIYAEAPKPGKIDTRELESKHRQLMELGNSKDEALMALSTNGWNLEQAIRDMPGNYYN